MDHKLKVIGVVLAGGESRRFGSPKLFAEWGGATFFEKALNTITPFSDELVAVVRKEWIGSLERKHSHSVEIISDVESFKGKGPLAGIYSAMMRTKGDYYLITPCDMPRMSSGMYKKWLETAFEHPMYDCIVPVLNGKVYPLNGIYKRSCLHEMKENLMKDNLKVLSLLSRKNTKYIEVRKEEAHFFENVNTKEDLLNLRDE
ncbi:molybdenum cofactor guanylyltransferase [Fictibacillus norfolkensis]|uniref:Probable molybdenum cofactor guanylyltransferase n=1 Tax=Fictibacillus norfolkensis TaxID=2762233 RepID=A0ABR8SN30_9BACL|nr:molybdenum cofactor guanylyltransferase [Fictibacillus norfolkensis]MBD7964514.1 molybdenum cofactor guanylyltransferase [Fictibacillus norfolkensis]